MDGSDVFDLGNNFQNFLRRYFFDSIILYISLFNYNIKIRNFFSHNFIFFQIFMVTDIVIALVFVNNSEKKC